MAKLDVRIRSLLKQRLAEKGWSGDRLALESGVSKTFIYGYLRAADSCKTITIATLEKLAVALEIKVRDLIP